MVAYVVLALASLFISGNAWVAEHQETANADRVSRWLESPLKDEQGNTVGSISDVVTDPKGQVAFLIVAEPSAPERFLPVPVSALHKGSAGQSLLEISREDLADAPRFAPKDWPDFRDPAYTTHVKQFYAAAENHAHHLM
jgi:hypothetical protein